EYGRLRLNGLRDTSYISDVLRTGRPAVVADDATDQIAAVLRPGAARDLLHELAPSSAVVLPLSGRGRITGLLSLFRGPGSPAFSDDELDTAADLAGRAGLALDNA